MPSHRRLGPDGRHCLHDRWKPPIQLKEEQAIGVGKLDPTAHLAMKHDQLMSERSILSLKPTDRPERRTNSLIHKSEGSEYPAVVIPIMTQHYAMLQRNLLYTGVTRGKRLVVLVGQKKAVAIAVRNVSGRRRWSKLGEWLEPKTSRVSADTRRVDDEFPRSAQNLDRAVRGS